MDKFLALINEINTVIKSYQEKLEEKQKKFASLESRGKQVDKELVVSNGNINTCKRKVKKYQSSDYIIKHPIKGTFLYYVKLSLFSLLIILIATVSAFIIIKNIGMIWLGIGALTIHFVSNILDSVTSYTNAKKYLENNTLEELNADLEQAEKIKLELSQEKEKVYYDKINCELEIESLQKAISEEMAKLKTVEDLRANALAKLIGDKFEKQLDTIFDENAEMKKL